MKISPWIRILVVSIMVALGHGQMDKALTMVETTAVIIGLQQYFRSGCVFFLHSAVRTDFELRDELSLVRLSKTMSQNKVQSVALSMGTREVSMKALRCQKNRPVNILTSDDDIAKTSLRELARHTDFARSIWLLLLSVEMSIDTFFTGIEVPVDSEMIVAHKDSKNIKLTEVYNVRKDYPLQLYQFGQLTDQNVLAATEVNFYERRSDLRGIIMQAVTVQDLPYTSVTLYTNGTVELTGGFFGLVWKEFENKLNFKTNYTYLDRESDMYKGDGRKSDPYWNMVNEVKQRKYEVAVAPFRCISERAEVVDFTYLMHRSKFVIALTTAANEDMAWSHFFGPFQFTLWIGLMACILVIAGCLSLFHYLGQRYAYPEYETPKQYTFYVSVFYVFSMFCQQGHDVTPKSCACRLVYWLGYVTAVVVLAAYSATLISFLTIQNKDPYVKTLDALAKDRTYKLGMLRQYLRIIRNGSDNGITDDMYDRMIAPDPKNIPVTSLEGLQRVCTKRYAFWTSMEAVKEVGDAVDCNIAFLTYNYMFNLAMVITENNPYRRIINYQISMMRSGGVLRKHKLDSWAAHVPESQNTWKSVTLGQISPLLTILSGGVATSMVLLLIEKGASYWQKQGQRRNTWSGQIRKQLHAEHLLFRV